MNNNQHEVNLARSRDIASKNITDMAIYRTLVENVVNMDSAISDKIAILLQVIPDLGMIMSHLSLCKSRGLLPADEYTKLVNNCLLQLNSKKQNIDFDPTLMVNEMNGA